MLYYFNVRLFSNELDAVALVPITLVIDARLNVAYLNIALSDFRLF